MGYLSFSEKMAARLLVHFRKASERSRIKMMRVAMKLFEENRTSGDEKSEIMYRCLLHAVHMDHGAANRIRTKELLDDREAERLFKIRVSEIKGPRKRTARKEERLKLQYMELVGELRKEGLSWRQTAAYLKKYHAFKISHVYIQKIFSKHVSRGGIGSF